MYFLENVADTIYIDGNIFILCNKGNKNIL